MSNVLAGSTQELESITRLIGKDIPNHRKAYSDRTAWLMSCLSELAYIRFNPLFSTNKQKDYFIQSVSKLIDKSNKELPGEKLNTLSKLVDVVAYDHEAEEEKLKEELDQIQMILIDTFDEDGTQAILVSFKDFLVLAFRGTEATSIKDIKSDAKATTKACESGGKIHSGFDEAYRKVAVDIQRVLDQESYSNKALYITGHSLGGALATIAAKKLNHKGGLAACYTFGSPRVGNDVWIENIKTPIYRLVNSADCVTMLPPSSETITITSWIFQHIPFVGKYLRKILLSKFEGYLHCGNMRYLKNCTSGNYRDVKLLYSVSLFYRLKGFFIKKLPWKHFLADHSISVYRKKLMQVAISRNTDK